MRRTIGLLTTGFWHQFSKALFEGAREEATLRGLTFVALPGNELDSPGGSVTRPSMANGLYQLIRPADYAGLIVWTGALGNFVGPERLEAFLDGLGIPLVTVGRRVKTYPCLEVAVEDGTRSVLEHLIEVHGKRRILFLRGPAGHQDCDRRLDTYRQVLADRGLPYRASLVTPPVAGWPSVYDLSRPYLDGPESGPSVGRLLPPDLVPVRDYDAVLGATDQLAAVAVRELGDAGYLVPADLAVAGLDGDPSSGRILTPGLTTADLQMETLGARAVRALDELLRTGHPAEEPARTCRPVVRSTCGCPPPASASPVPSLPPEVVRALTEALGRPEGLREAGFLDEWVRALGLHASTVEKDSGAWQRFLWGPEAAGLSEGTRNRAEAWLRRTGDEQEAFSRNRWARENERILMVTQKIGVQFQVSDLGSTLKDLLPLLGIGSHLLALYRDPRDPSAGVYPVSGSTLPPDGEPAPGGNGWLQDELDRSGAPAFALLPLYFDQDHLGVCLFEHPRGFDPEVLQNLSSQVSTALKGARLKEEITQKMESLHQAQATLREKEKMAVLGSLAAGVTHEINSPLGAIVSANGLLETLTEKLPGLVAEAVPHLGPQERQTLRVILGLLDHHRPILPNQEARARRRRLAGELEAFGLTRQEADDHAEFLVDAGFTGLPPGWEGLTRSPGRAQLFPLVRDLMETRRTSAVITLAANKMKDYVLAIRRYIDNEERRSTPGPVDLAETVETVLAINSGVLKGGLRLESRITVRPWVMGRREDLIQLWSHLVGNALQALGTRGTLGVEVGAAIGEALVTVQDTGPGIPVELQKKVFQDFYTTRALGEGTGLGLGIVRQIVTEHNGVLELESRPGMTRFRVRLPLAGA